MRWWIQRRTKVQAGNSSRDTEAAALEYWGHGATCPAAWRPRRQVLGAATSQRNCVGFYACSGVPWSWYIWYLGREKGETWSLFWDREATTSTGRRKWRIARSFDTPSGFWLIGFSFLLPFNLFVWDGFRIFLCFDLEHAQLNPKSKG